MTGRRHRGERRPALFAFDAGEPTTAPDVADNPLSRPCPHCRAQPIEPCTRPGRGPGGRVRKKTYCEARTNPTAQENR